MAEALNPSDSFAPVNSLRGPIVIWEIALLSLLAAGAIHGYQTRDRGPGRIPEMMLIYLLTVYCGVLQIVVAVMIIYDPDWVAINMTGTPPGNPIMAWTGFTYLGLAATAVLTPWFRGPYLIAPTLGWGIYWAGATYAHAAVALAKGGDFANVIAGAFLSHGIVAVILLGLTVSLLLSRRTAGQAQVIA
jgi:hypothetical protein